MWLAWGAIGGVVVFNIGWLLRIPIACPSESN